MTDNSELIERLEELGGTLGNPAARLIRDLIAERDAAHAKGWNEAIEAGAEAMGNLWELYTWVTIFVDVPECVV